MCELGSAQQSKAGRRAACSAVRSQLRVETVRWEEIAVYSNIRGKREEKDILTEKTSMTNKLQNRKIIHMLELLGVIHKFGIVIAVYQVLYAS